MAMERVSPPLPVTLVYKTVFASDSAPSEGMQSTISLHLDVYSPSPHLGGTIASEGGTGVPSVVYFHGGGLVNGDRKSWFPEWLRRRLAERGVAVISADYRLLPSSTGHDIVEDIKDLFTYIRSQLNSALAAGGANLKIDVDAIGVAGSSAGGLCAYLCAMHVSPKPRALLPIYAQAGECLNDHFLMPKTKPFIQDVPLVDPSDWTEFVYPQSLTLPVIAEAPVEYCPSTDSTCPGLLATKRLSLSRFYYQLGQWLDYYTGDHTLSKRLRELRSPSVISGLGGRSTLDPIKARDVIGEKNFELFPQFGVTESWPPTLFLHGAEDTEVPLHESKHLAEKLKAVGVENELIVVEGQAHGFDFFSDPEEFGGIFDRVAAFLVRNLQK